MTRQQLLGELEDVLRTMPALDNMQVDASPHAPWFGRCSAALRRWDAMRVLGPLDATIKGIQRPSPDVYRPSYTALVSLDP